MSCQRPDSTTGARGLHPLAARVLLFVFVADFFRGVNTKPPDRGLPSQAALPHRAPSPEQTPRACQELLEQAAPATHLSAHPPAPAGPRSPGEARPPPRAPPPPGLGSVPLPRWSRQAFGGDPPPPTSAADRENRLHLRGRARGRRPGARLAGAGPPPPPPPPVVGEVVRGSRERVKGRWRGRPAVGSEHVQIATASILRASVTSTLHLPPPPAAGHPWTPVRR